MALYATYATNSTLPLHNTYNPAAKIANSQCGDTYAPLIDGKNAAGSVRIRGTTTLATLWRDPLVVGVVVSVMTTLLFGVDSIVGFS